MPLNIKELRAKSGFTQAELAERLEVTRQTIINWEKGQSKPDADELRRLALAMDVEVSEITLTVDREKSDADKIPFYDMKHAVIILLLLLACKEEDPAPSAGTDKGCLTGVKSGTRQLIRCSTYAEFTAGSNVSRGGTSSWNLYTDHKWEKCSQCQ